MRNYIFKLNILFLILFILFGYTSQSIAKEKLILVSTTSTLDSGLFDVLIPAFEKKFNCHVRVIAVGTGQAIRLAKDGNADVVLIHDRTAENKFVAEGYGLKRLDVMHNDFLIVGPKNDPAGIRSQKSEVRSQKSNDRENVLDAFKKIYATKSFFVSRGDDSGTHKAELRIWKQLQITPGGKWYIESGTGMEMTLRIVDEKNAYCLVDRATWLSHKKEIDTLQILVEGDSILYNPYSVIVVSPTKFPWANFKLAQKFADFIRSQEGQKLIKNYGVDKFGEPLFFPDVVK
ncbi:MAG: substrate-binding domain-containing protein [bacterium]|nr:substrate-binding domain-containing protein [bacterium]